MSTASTKRARKRRRAQGGASASYPAARTQARETAPAQPSGSEVSDQVWLVASVCILILATALRVYDLELKPMHHDEGVNGYFLTNLIRRGEFHYNPTNYHGPTLYYLSLPATAVFGLSTFALRFVTAAFGVGVVWLVLSLRRRLGSVGALAAAAFVAVSPGLVFYSRYYIHEVPFVFFTLGVVVAALRFYETGALTYLMLASASGAMLFATKETAFISVGTLGLAWLVARLWAGGAGGSRAKKGGGEEAGGLARLREGGRLPLALGGAAALFAFLWVLFYSSFFTHWQGAFWDSFKAFDVWSKTGMSAFHGKPFDTYVKLLVKQEAPILVLAAVGSAVALFERRKNRFAIFSGAWGFGLLLAYSIISYKTPWLVISFVLPMALAAGYAVQSFDRLGPAGMKGRAPALLVASAALGFCLYQSVVLNFREYDNEQYPYVYSHTQREALQLVAEIERLAEATGRGKDTAVTVAAPEYWPLPWYLRDYKGVGYPGQVAASYDPLTTPIVVGRESVNPKENQMEQLRAALGGGYRQVGVYALRPGVRLALFARRDLGVR